MAINYPVVNPNEEIKAVHFNALRRDVVRNAGDFGITAGTANAQTLAIDGDIAGGDIVDGFKVRFIAGFTTSSPTPTLNVNGTGALTIISKFGSAIPNAGILQGGYYEAVKTGANWQISNNDIEADNVLPCRLAAAVQANEMVGVSMLLESDDGLPIVGKYNGPGGSTEWTTSNGWGQNMSDTWMAGHIADEKYLLAGYSSGTANMYVAVVTIDFDNRIFKIESEAKASSVTIGTTAQITEVDNGKFVAVYTNTANSTCYVRAISVSGTTITLGTTQTINSSSQLNDLKLATNKFLLKRNDGGVIKVRAGSVSGTTITLGTEVSFNASVVNYGEGNDVLNCGTILDNQIFAGYTAYGSTDLFLQGGTVSGTTITLTPLVTETIHSQISFTMAVSAQNKGVLWSNDSKTTYKTAIRVVGETISLSSFVTTGETTSISRLYEDTVIVQRAVAASGTRLYKCSTTSHASDIEVIGLAGTSDDNPAASTFREKTVKEKLNISFDIAGDNKKINLKSFVVTERIMVGEALTGGDIGEIVPVKFRHSIHLANHDRYMPGSSYSYVPSTGGYGAIRGGYTALLSDNAHYAITKNRFIYL